MATTGEKDHKHAFHYSRRNGSEVYFTDGVGRRGAGEGKETLGLNVVI